MNPYKQWLGITTNSQPDHFQLLGVSRDEQDLDTIKAAAQFQFRKIKKHQSGEHQATAEKLLGRVKKAYRVVSHPDLRQDYLELLAAKEREIRDQINDKQIVIPIGKPKASNGNSTVLLGLVIAFGVGCCLLSALALGVFWLSGLLNRSDSETLASSDTPRAIAQTDANPVSKSESPAADLSNGTERGDNAATGIAASLPTEDSFPELGESQEIALAHQAIAVLKASCYSCHGEAGEDEGGFGFVLDREQLVSSGHVVPKNPAESVLMQRMISADSPMPPEGEQPRPTSDQIEIVNQWILAGAPNTSKRKTTPYISPSDLYAAVAANLKQVGAREREFIRYFSISHLANAGASPAELETNRQALAKLLNSLSWNRKLAKLKPLANQPTVFQIDLRDLKWTTVEWDLLMLDYPYGVIVDSGDVKFVSDATKCEVPVLRGDWFVGTASRPPLYHELLRIPNTDFKLEEQLQVDVKGNIRENQVQRIGFARSGVSQNNRLLERHESAVGAYWKSYDFGGNTGRKNLFETPLGPGRRSDQFLHDGGEIIFQLPNGMLGYMLTDAEGQRIDRGPLEIVSDPRQPDRAVVNGVSCMSCHYGGFIQKADEIRELVASNKNSFKSFKTIMALYPEPQNIDPKLEADTKKYLVALASDAVGIKKPTRNGEPVVLVSNRFGSELDAALASAELGLPKANFIKALVDLGDADLSRTVGVLRLGGVVKRETFEDVFIELVDKLNLGRAPRIASSPAARRRLAERKRASQIAGGDIGSKFRGRTAQFFLNEGAKAVSKEQWGNAAVFYEKAVRATPDPAIQRKAYKELIPIYERSYVRQKLINAHKFLLNSIHDSNELEAGVNRLFASIIRQQANQTPARKDRWDALQLHSTDGVIHGSEMILWGEVKLPVSTGNLIAETFELELKRDPFYEPALLVLNANYGYVHKNDSRLKDILERLGKLRGKRGQQVEPLDQLKLAATLMTSGNYRKAAELYASVNQGHVRSAGFLRMEAHAWEKANHRQKAINVYKESNEAYKFESGRVYNKIAVAAGLARCGDPDAAIKIYMDLLKNPESKSYIERIEKQLIKAVALSKTADPVALGVEELMDPLREFRLAAEKLENKKHTDPLRRCKTLIRAAENWSQANDPTKALAAINQASLLLDTAKEGEYGIEGLHRDIGKAYHELKENEKAFEHFSASIRLADSKYDIEKDQEFIQSLLDGKNPLKMTDEVKRIISPEFKYRSLASLLESELPPSSPSHASNLNRAIEYWIKAKEIEEVKRCGLLAENAIKALRSNRKSYPVRELAKLYAEAGLDEKAVQQYVSAMNFADRDDQAVKLYEKVKEICRRSNIPLPTLTPAIEAKLDPLNRFRVAATQLEVESKLASETAPTKLLEALENWLKAGEKTKASDTADKIATALLKNKKRSDYAPNCAKLAAYCLYLEDETSARKFYQLAIENETNDATKAKFQSSLDALDK